MFALLSENLLKGSVATDPGSWNEVRFSTVKFEEEQEPEPEDEVKRRLPTYILFMGPIAGG